MPTIAHAFVSTQRSGMFRPALRPSFLSPFFANSRSSSSSSSESSPPSASPPATIDPLHTALAELALRGIHCLVHDGGMATTLEERGGRLHPQLWSAALLADDSGRALIRSVHSSFLESGSRIVTTCSYQASRENLMKHLHCSGAEAEQMMRSSVTLAAEARAAFLSSAAPAKQSLRPLVALGLGCYGAILAGGEEYTGHYPDASLASLSAFHRERLAVYLPARKDIDFVLFETILSALEIDALIGMFSAPDEALRVAAPLPLVLSLACRDAVHLNDGTKVSAALSALLKAREALARQGFPLVAISFNCTPPQHISDLLRAASAAIDAHAVPSGTLRPLLMVYPNSGEVWDAAKRCWQAASERAVEEQFAKWALEWVECGARIIGGCCRITPRIIQRIADAIEKHAAADSAPTAK
jgi:homocysteine S-methyltransferase